jgi:glycosyltransferase involved in cell wall biosynthesis
LRILILGYLVPDDLVAEICKTAKMPPMQAHRYLKGLTEALDSASETPVDMISVLPVNDYPYSPEVFVGFRKWKGRPGNGIWWGLPFINVFPLKHLTRYTSAVFFGSLWALRHLREKKCIVVVSAASPSLSAGWILAKLSRAKMVPCLMDPPSQDLPTDGGIKAKARRLDRKISISMLHRADALIGVTEPLAKMFCPVKPTTVFEGTVPVLPDEPAAAREETRFVAAYAGALGAVYGIPMLLEAFKQLDPEKYALWLFGKGECEDLIRETSQQHPNIQFFGFLTSGLEPQLRSADLLLMVRPSEGDDTALCFPNKIHHSMALGVSTGITRLKGLGQEYFDHSYLLDDSSTDALADSIRRIRELPKQERMAQAEKMIEFVRNEKSPTAMGGALYAWLRHVTEGEHE